MGVTCAPGAGGCTASASEACGRRAAVGEGIPKSLAAAGGRRAWSRTKSYVSELVVHLIPLPVPSEGTEKNGGIDGFDSAGKGRDWKVGDVLHSRHGGGLMRPDGRRDTW